MVILIAINKIFKRGYFIIGRLKVLQIVTLSEMGGAQKVVYHIAAGLDAWLFDMTVACAPDGELVKWLRELPHEVRVVEIPELKRNISPFLDFMALMRLYRLIQKNGFDIVHCHSSKAGILGRLAAWLAGVKKIFFTAHGWGINEFQSLPIRLFYTWAEQLAGTFSTKIICVSESDLVKGRNLRLAASNKLVVIHNGMPDLKDQKGNLRRELNIDDEDIVIGTVARLALQKNPLFFLEVARQTLAYLDIYPYEGHAFFVIIGDGPLRAECEELIKSKGLSERVFLLGSREDAAALTQDFDVFVLLSLWEGLPLTIIEAMLASVSVIASDVGGVRELVIHKETGYLLSEYNVGKTAKVLLNLIYDKEKRQTMGKLGRKRASEYFGIKSMIKKYKELYLS